ncbi:hypothetical protein D3C80_1357940 [compost metagenome]
MANVHNIAPIKAGWLRCPAVVIVAGFPVLECFSPACVLVHNKLVFVHNRLACGAVSHWRTLKPGYAVHYFPVEVKAITHHAIRGIFYRVPVYATR